MKKYVLHPGFVLSRTDGQRHYVGPNDLARLYGVSIGECVLIHCDWPETWKGRDLTGMIHLYPRYDGNYTSKEEP